MQLFHLHNHHILKKPFHSDFWLLELAIWLFVFGRSMVAVFIPIFLLESGFTLSDVLVYYFLFAIVGTPLNFVAKKLIQRIGGKRVMTIGIICEIVFFGILFVLTTKSWPLFVLLVCFAALYDAFYWVAHLYIFAETDPVPEASGKDTSILFQVKQLAGLIAPVMGAVCIYVGGQHVVIGVSLLIIICSLVPLFAMSHVKDKPAPGSDIRFRDFFADIREKKDYASWVMYTFHAEAEMILWPLFIFITLGTIESVAIVPVIVSVSGIFFTYMLGSTVEQKRERIIMTGSALIVLVWVLRLFTDSTPLMYISVFLIGLFELMLLIPLSTNILSRSKEYGDPLSAMTIRNASYVCCMIVVYGVLLLFVNFFQMSFIAAIMSLLMIVCINGMFLWRRQYSRGT